MAKITVIVPIYNVEKYLSRCIDSVLSQTFKDFELVLVDDGSPDKCPEMCDVYAQKDQRICVIHQKNGGLSAARNAAIDWAFKNSNSEFLTFIDSDDWVCAQYLEILYNAYIKTGLDVIVGSYERTSDLTPKEELFSGEFEVFDTQPFYNSVRVNATIACGKLVKKSLFEDIRYPVGKIHEDEYTTYRLLFKKEKIAFVKEPLYKYYISPDSITCSKWNVRRLDSLGAFERQMSYFKDNGFTDSYNDTICIYIESTAKCIVNLREIGEKEKASAYRKKLKKSIRKYRSIIGSKYKDDKRVSLALHPKLYRMRKYLKKRISNLTELLNVK